MNCCWLADWRNLSFAFISGESERDLPCHVDIIEYIICILLFLENISIESAFHWSRRIYAFQLFSSYDCSHSLRVSRQQIDWVITSALRKRVEYSIRRCGDIKYIPFPSNTQDFSLNALIPVTQRIRSREFSSIQFA